METDNLDPTFDLLPEVFETEDAEAICEFLMEAFQKDVEKFVPLCDTGGSQRGSVDECSVEVVGVVLDGPGTGMVTVSYEVVELRDCRDRTTRSSQISKMRFSMDADQYIVSVAPEEPYHPSPE